MEGSVREKSSESLDHQVNRCLPEYCACTNSLLCDSTLSARITLNNVVMFLPNLIKSTKSLPHVETRELKICTMNINPTRPCVSCSGCKEYRMQKYLNEVIGFDENLCGNSTMGHECNDYLKTTAKLNNEIKNKSTRSLDNILDQECFRCRVDNVKDSVDDCSITSEKSSKPSASVSFNSQASNVDALKRDIRLRIKDLKKQMRNLNKISKLYKNDQNLSSGQEEFLKSCLKFREQIKNQITENEVKLDLLERQSEENFKSGDPNDESVVKNLVNQIDETIKLSKYAKNAGLITESIEKLIKSCKSSKQHIKTESSDHSQMLGSLLQNIDNILITIKKYQSEGLVTNSLQSFLDNLLAAKEKIYGSTCSEKESGEGVVIYSSLDNMLSGACTCNPSYCSVKSKPSTVSVGDKLKQYKDKYHSSNGETLNGPNPPCKSCAPVTKKKEEPFPCKSCKEKEKPTVCCPPKQPEKEKPPICCQSKQPVSEKAPSEKSICCVPLIRDLKPIPKYASDHSVCFKPQNETDLKADLLSSATCCPNAKNLDDTNKSASSICKPPSKPPEEAIDLSTCCVESKPCCEDIQPDDTTPECQREVESGLGYFETKVRKITKITRYLNSDGTIREDKEIVTINSSRHDPNKTDMTDDEDDFMDHGMLTENNMPEMDSTTELHTEQKEQTACCENGLVENM